MKINFRWLTTTHGGHLAAFAVKVIAGLIVAFLLFWGGKIYQKHEARSRVEQFLDTAEDFLRREDYAEIRKLGEHLPDEVRRDKDVDLELLKNGVLETAVKQDVSGVLESSTLNDLWATAYSLDKLQKNGETAALLGVIDSLRDNPQLAHKDFALAVKRDPKLAIAYNYWGFALVQWELPDGADSWQVAAEKKFKQAHDLSANYEWPLINLGFLTLSKADTPSEAVWEAANKYFLEAERAVPDSPNAYMDSAVCLLNIGLLHQQQNDPTGATEYFGQTSAKLKKAQELGLNSAVLHLNWGYLFEVTKDAHRALDQYEKALQATPTFLPACFSKATLLQETGDLKSATLTYKRCRDLLEQRRSNFHARVGVTPDPAAAEKILEWESEASKKLSSLDLRIQEIESDLRTKAAPLTRHSEVHQ